MNTVKQFVVDAFAGKTFEGNPAAVCVLDSPPSRRSYATYCGGKPFFGNGIRHT